MRARRALRLHRWLGLGLAWLVACADPSRSPSDRDASTDAASSDAAPSDAAPSDGAPSDGGSIGTSVFLLHENFVEARLDASTWALWNSVGPNDTARTPVSGEEMVRSLTRQLYAAGLPDQYTLIYFVLNNDDYPAMMPTGEFAFVKNDVEGVGEPIFDDSAAYGSSGALEGTVTLYRRDAIAGCGARGYADGSQPPSSPTSCGIGPILHETAHRYANWIVPPATGHWIGTPAEGTGRLSSTTVPYSGIELYLLGLIPAAQLTGTDAAAYAAIPAPVPARVPAAGVAPTTQNVLVVVLTPDPLGTDPTLNDGVDAHATAVKVLTSTTFDTDLAALSPARRSVFRLNNYFEQTGNRATLRTPLPATLP